MAVLPIRKYGDDVLRRPAEPVTEIDASLQTLIDDMIDTMYAAPGVGLAATQIGEAYQLFVVDVAEQDQPSDLKVFINPEILESHDEITWTEGCLSFPGITEDVDRAARVKVRALDREGKPFVLEAEGLLAVAIQHEYDHLQGVLMIDHLGPLKKRMVDRKMKKRAEERAAP